MTKCWSKCLLACLGVIVLLASTVLPAEAQYRPLNTAKKVAARGAKGENYIFEIAANYWNPDPNLVGSSNGMGVQGTTIDATANLGIQKQAIYDLRAVLKVSQRNKFRFAYLPTTYTSTAALNATVTFKGIQYPVDAQVTSEFQWKTYRVGYEFDFVSTPAGFMGITLDAKITQMRIKLSNDLVGSAEASAKAPIPAIGAITRWYIAPGVSLSAEYTYFKLPSNMIKDATGSYTEYDFYAGYNVTENIGVRAGYRKINVNVAVKEVTGQAKLSGTYFGAAVRF